VAPAELEALLLSHRKVADAAVIGVWSEAEATELPRAYIKPKTGLELLKTEAARRAFEEEIAQFVEHKVAHYKQLRGGIVLVDKIPKSPAGKILRRSLREMAKEGMNVPALPQVPIAEAPAVTASGESERAVVS
jgi:4-coumarate--CoA ligase